MTNNDDSEIRYDHFSVPADELIIKRPAIKANAPIIDQREALEYWHEYDNLMADLGHAWIQDYMSKIDLSFINDQAPSPHEVAAALSKYHDDFAASLLGEEDNPGVLVQVVIAGMAAANSAVRKGLAADPQHPRAKAGIEIPVDWNLLAEQARDFAKSYVYNLIKNLDDTTMKVVQKAVAAWIESGEPLSALRSRLSEIFNDSTRAQLIAQTESTRAFAAGAQESYRRADIKKVTWNTVRMPVGDSPGDVCPICHEFEARGPQPVDSFDPPPAHPGCRCWLRPVVIGEEL